MAYLGVLFSLDENEVGKLKSFGSDQEKLDYLQEEIEATYFEEYPQRVAELDKAWDVLHRSLTDGRLEYTNGTFPLSHVVLGGEMIYSSGDYIMTLKAPNEVKRIAEELTKLNRSKLKDGYQKIDSKDYGFPLTDAGFEFTWAWFESSQEFWTLAANEGRHVLFTADQ